MYTKFLETGENYSSYTNDGFEYVGNNTDSAFIKVHSKSIKCTIPDTNSQTSLGVYKQCGALFRLVGTTTGLPKKGYALLGVWIGSQTYALMDVDGIYFYFAHNTGKECDYYCGWNVPKSELKEGWNFLRIPLTQTPLESGGTFNWTESTNFLLIGIDTTTWDKAIICDKGDPHCRDLFIDSIILTGTKEYPDLDIWNKIDTKVGL